MLGYHGCSAETAEKVLKGEKFEISRNPYDWLGEGIYFWEANPRAVFQEGVEAFDGSKFMAKTHVQIAVLDQKQSIRGVFRVPDDDLIPA